MFTSVKTRVEPQTRQKFTNSANYPTQPTVIPSQPLIYSPSFSMYRKLSTWHPTFYDAHRLALTGGDSRLSVWGDTSTLLISLCCAIPTVASSFARQWAVFIEGLFAQISRYFFRTSFCISMFSNFVFFPNSAIRSVPTIYAPG